MYNIFQYNVAIVHNVSQVKERVEFNDKIGSWYRDSHLCLLYYKSDRYN